MREVQTRGNRVMNPARKRFESLTNWSKSGTNDAMTAFRRCR